MLDLIFLYLFSTTQWLEQNRKHIYSLKENCISSHKGQIWPPCDKGQPSLISFFLFHLFFEHILFNTFNSSLFHKLQHTFNM